MSTGKLSRLKLKQQQASKVIGLSLKIFLKIICKEIRIIYLNKKNYFLLLLKRMIKELFVIKL